MQNVEYFIITGAGAGLGRAFCLQLAEQGYGILAVSLHGPELQELQKEIKAKDFHSMAIDLTDPLAIETIIGWLDDLKIYPIGLINNAGMGYSKPFQTLSTKFVKTLTSLNVNATALLTHAMLPYLQKHKRAYVLNIASMAAFLPMPYKSLYAASKSFVLQFSLALNQELKGQGLTVSCACPGPINTSEEVRQRIAAAGWKKGLVGALEAEHAAKACLMDMFEGKGRIILRWQDRLLLGVSALVPKVFLPNIMNRLYRNSF